MPRPALFVVASSLLALFACSNPFGEDPPPPSAPDLPAPEPAEPARTERTGPVDPAHVAVLRETEKGCNFFVSTQPGDAIAPITRLPGECPVWFEVAWHNGRMVMLADGVPMTFDERQAVALPEPEHSSAIALRGEQILVCGSGDETWTEKDGKVVFTADGKSYDAAKTVDATDYALARRYAWTGSAWKQEAIGAVPVFASMSDAACTALDGWPGGDRLDPSQARWGSGDWAPTGAGDGALLAAIEAGEWSIDPTRTVAVRGTWSGERFAAQGPVALWVGGAWLPIEGTRQGPLVFSIAPDWILYDVENGQSRLVSRRDGTETWADETDGPIFLWPADLALPAEREREAKRGDEGKARERKPRHGRPDGRPGKPAHPEHPGKDPRDKPADGGGRGGKPGRDPDKKR